jgi:hypothetical protein
MFFVELRERYVCTWCETDDGRLLLVIAFEQRYKDSLGLIVGGVSLS